MTMTNPSPEKIVEDKNTILSLNEKKQLREYMKKNPTEVQKQAILSLENNFKVKDLINTKKPTEMNREEIAVIQLYANLKGNKIAIDGIYGPKTTGAVNTLKSLMNTGKSIFEMPVDAPKGYQYSIFPGKLENNKPLSNNKYGNKEVISPVNEKKLSPVSKDKNIVKKKDEIKKEKPISPVAKENISTGNEKGIRKIDLSHINNSVDMSIAYLSHQQGAEGAAQILKGLLYGKDVSKTVLSNMKGNVGKDFKNFTGVPRSNINAKTFFTYRHNKLSDNVKNHGNATTDFEGAFQRVAKETGISLPLLKAIVFTESGFNPNNGLGKGTQYKGLMALGTDVRVAYGVKNPFDPYENMIGGVKLIKDNTKSLVGLSNTIKSQGIANILGSNKGNQSLT